MGDAESPAAEVEATRQVRWPQVTVLGLLQGAISLSWIVYALYLPALLIALGLDATLAATLLLLEGVLAIALEPTFGLLSDHAFRRVGTRLPFVVGGAFFAAALFISIPLAVAKSPVGSATARPLFLSLVIGWAVAMTVFRTPAISLLSRYSSAPNLPRAAGVLTLLGACVAALRPVSRDFFLSLGPAVCFGGASLVLLGACAAVWFMDRRAPASALTDRTQTGKLLGPIVTLVATGAGLALAQFALLTQLLPRLFGMLPLGGSDLSRLTAAALIFLGLSAVGAGALAKRIGNERSMLIGAGAASLLLAVLAYMSPSPPVLITLIAAALVAFSLVANGVIPLALGRLPSGRAGLALGCYFGGLSATASIIASRFRAPVSVGEATSFALIGLALVAAAVWAGHRPAVPR